MDDCWPLFTLSRWLPKASIRSAPAPGLSYLRGFPSDAAHGGARPRSGVIDPSKPGDLMKLVYLAVAIGLLLASAPPLLFYLQGRFGNPRVERELVEELRAGRFAAASQAGS